jgi:hypothetical protein
MSRERTGHCPDKVKRAGVVTVLIKLLPCREITVENNEFVRQSVDLHEREKSNLQTA